MRKAHTGDSWAVKVVSPIFSLEVGTGLGDVWKSPENLNFLGTEGCLESWGAGAGAGYAGGRGNIHAFQRPFLHPKKSSLFF